MAKLTLIMLSDWHVGSGTGIPGNIDRTVRRDSEGFPFIPGKTLTGIWRDACERVALGLDEGNAHGSWHNWVCYLFGDQPAIAKDAIETPPRKAALSVRPAYLSECLRTALQDKPLLKEALTFIKPGIAIDSYSGCTKSDCLRFEEMVRVGATLTANYSLADELDVYSPEYKTAQSLLAAGAAMVERLGAKRRRGVGSCEMTLDYKLEESLEWLEKHPELPKPPQELNNLFEVIPSVLSERNWYQVELIITAKTPLLIYKRTVGNVVETLDYLPGTYLLPIIHKHLGVNLGEAIAHGDILVTNATLGVEGNKGKPVPFALFGEKLNKQKVYNLLQVSQEGKPQLKGYRSGYMGENLNQLASNTVNLGVGTHNTVSDEVQRPNEDVGGVYSYETIAPGTRFISQLRLREYLVKTLNKNEWWNSLAGTYQIGRSSKDDYGLVSLEVSNLEKFSVQSENLSKQLTVWLLSDVLLRNERLRPTTHIDDFTEALEKELEVKLKLREKEALPSNFVRSHRTESWHTKWNLPRPSLVGLQAGTCMVYQVDGDLNANKHKLIELQASGIGERRAEGYGQLCFNHPLLTQQSFSLASEPSTKSQEKKEINLIPQDNAAFDYAQLIEKEAWREAIYRAALAIAADKTWRKENLGIEIYLDNIGIKKSKPPMSQLGALRSVLARVQEFNDVETFINWIECLPQTNNRKDKWSRESLDLIKTLVQKPNQVWELLNLDIAQLTLTQQTEENKLTNQLWSEAVNVLIDACIRAHKRDCEL